MQTSAREILAVKFADCMAQLKSFGLKGEVSVVGGLVMIATSDKFSAKIFRRDAKAAAAKCGSVFCENRPAKGSYVFTVCVL